MLHAFFYLEIDFKKTGIAGKFRLLEDFRCGGRKNRHRQRVNPASTQEMNVSLGRDWSVTPGAEIRKSPQVWYQCIVQCSDLHTASAPLSGANCLQETLNITLHSRQFLSFYLKHFYAQQYNFANMHKISSP